MIVQICVGSSCHLKGSQEIVELFQKNIEEYGLENDITLAGCFCMDKCNRIGVTITVDGTIYTGVTVAGFDEFFKDKVLSVVNSQK